MEINAKKGEEIKEAIEKADDLKKKEETVEIVVIEKDLQECPHWRKEGVKVGETVDVPLSDAKKLFPERFDAIADEEIEEQEKEDKEIDEKVNKKVDATIPEFKNYKKVELIKYLESNNIKCNKEADILELALECQKAWIEKHSIEKVIIKQEADPKKIRIQKIIGNDELIKGTTALKLVKLGSIMLLDGTKISKDDIFQTRTKKEYIDLLKTGKFKVA